MGTRDDRAGWEVLKSSSVCSPPLPPTRDKTGEGLSNCCDIKSACQDQAKSASWNLLSLHEIWRAFIARGCLPEHYRSTASRLSLGHPLLVTERSSVTLYREKTATWWCGDLLLCPYLRKHSLQTLVSQNTPLSPPQT